MVLSYEDWKKAKELAKKASTAVGDVAEGAITAALAEIPVVGVLLGEAVKKGLDYSAEEIVDMIPHEYPAGIGYVAGDTRTLNKLLSSVGQPPMNPASITKESDRKLREDYEKSILLRDKTPPDSVEPAAFITAPFGLGPRAAALPGFNAKKIRSEEKKSRPKRMKKPDSNPYGVGAVVPKAVHPRQVSGI